MILCTYNGQVRRDTGEKYSNAVFFCSVLSRIWSKTEIYGENILIQSEYEKMQTRKTRYLFYLFICNFLKLTTNIIQAK